MRASRTQLLTAEERMQAWALACRTHDGYHVTTDTTCPLPVFVNLILFYVYEHTL